MFPSIESISPGYTILDIRTADRSTTKLFNTTTGPSNASNIRMAPPSPPASTHPSLEDAFNSADLVDTILNSLDQPPTQKSIPTFVLYDTLGLQLFDQITHLDEYYLTNAERAILQQHADQLADRVKNGSIIIELGAGSLRKTELILKAMEMKKKRVTYYALDLDQHELEKSLSSLGNQFNYVQLYGLLGTYEQGIPWLSQQYTSRSTPKVVLWLGSSIGNQSRQESAIFLRRLQRTCLQPGDLCVIGFDRRNDPSVIAKAYDDPQGITRQFIMNGLDHVNVILGQALFNKDDFDYDSRYQSLHGRHVAHYRAKKDLTLTFSKKNGQRVVQVIKDELIHVEHSYKYNLAEISHILNAAELDLVEQWMDPKELYRLVLAECRPFHFERDNQGTVATLFPYDSQQTDDERLNCATCDTGASKQQVQQAQDDQQPNLPGTLVNITGTNRWPQAVPSLHEWEQLWTCWDVVTRTMIDHKTMLFERPIALRHPFLFYLGHIPAFLDIMLSRHQADQEIADMEGTSTALTEPSSFADIFERGIDPDIDDPTQCNPHSQVPSNNQDWPSVESILEYQQRVRLRLRRLLLHWETEGYNHTDDPLAWMIPSRQRAARVVWMCFEHEAMHVETLLYMLVQSPNIHPPTVAPPAWWYSQQQQQQQQQQEQLSILSSAPLISIKDNTTVQLGHDDDESMDGKKVTSVEFGWDNEHPKRTVPSNSFEIQSRPVTNGEYWQFWKENGEPSLWPASWIKKDDDDQLPQIKTSFGMCDMHDAVNWPVQVSCVQAEAYANANKMRLPSEEEWILFRQHMDKTPIKEYDDDQTLGRDVANIGFQAWTPLALNNQQVHVIGDVWEWTSTVWDSYQGYTPSELYPGYSADFLDGKHHVVLGASWATHPRMAERISFKNWYQAAYPYVFCGFRLCRSL
ncbi:uncharacterized protein BX664DRAFT_295507 [Halteromyces radiatus]|uniref:uncharacterized protein n=1 Tax=Halteromyces radiatus TaxID=101107 RepID=UPI00222066AD|nr:uncharacterized protein BX664DRAFT_295507 [Halteromyces radiatus]KAI8093632.1 hypothetical protein BX664DRAFT_295507 [Halteromyces radiatus]